MNDLTQIPEQLRVFSDAKEQIAAIAGQCKNIIINSKDSLESAKSLAKNAKKIETLIEEKRKEITAPLLTEQRNIKAFADGLTSDLNSAVKDLRKQITDFEVEQERIRIEEIRRLNEERRKQEEEARRKAEELEKAIQDKTEIKEEAIQALKDDLARLDEIKSEQGLVDAEKSKNIRMVWDFEVTDLTLVPYEFLMINDAKIKAAMKADVREIPGIRIYQKPQLHL